MKVFISWSGERSRQVAELLEGWLKCVIQGVSPWVSTKNIDRGSLWFTEISDQLSSTVTGIVCLTKENFNKSWILFEAGALAKGLTSSRVCTLLIDLEPNDLENPLAQFNHTFPTKDSLYSLVYTVNSSLKDARLSEAVLQKCFNAFYPQFEEEFAKIMKNTVEAKIEERQPPEILGEVLSSVREMEKRMRNLENESLRSMAKLESMILQNSNRVITFGDFNEKPKFTLDFLNKSINFDDTNNLFTSGSQSTPPNS